MSDGPSISILAGQLGYMFEDDPSLRDAPVAQLVARLNEEDRWARAIAKYPNRSDAAVIGQPLTMGHDAGNRGVLIPTTSLDQYGATLAKWFGVSPAAMAKVFPQLGNFATPDLGFMA